MPAVAVLILLAVLAGIIYAVLYAIRMERKNAQGRSDMAAMRGWNYFSSPRKREVFTLEGRGNGFSWSMVSRRGGRNSSGHTTWTCPDLQSGGGIVLMGPPGMGKLLRSPAVMRIAKWGLGMVKAVGAGLAGIEPLLETGAEVDTGDMEFQRRYSVIATDAALARRLVSQSSRDALKSWSPSGMGAGGGQRTLSVMWNENGLTLSLPHSISDPDEMARLADTGLALAREAVGSW